MFKTVACPQRPAWPRQPGKGSHAARPYRRGRWRASGRSRYYAARRFPERVPGRVTKHAPRLVASVRDLSDTASQLTCSDRAARQGQSCSPAIPPLYRAQHANAIYAYLIQAGRHNQNTRRRCASELAADEADGSGIGLCQSPLLNIMRRAVAPWY